MKANGHFPGWALLFADAAGGTPSGYCRALARIARILLLTLTLFGIMLPGVSAAVALATPGTQTVIICTGDGLKTITIDADGKAKVESQQDSHCLLVHVTDTARTVAAGPALMAPIGAVVRSPIGRISVPTSGAVRPQPRAPPFS